MEHQLSEEDLKNIAKQLACPEGEHGIKTGEMMHANNIGMTTSAIEALNLQNNETVLEIGHGNGGHIAQLLLKAENLAYFGADISATIIAEAEKINQDFITKGKVHFQLTDGVTLPFDDDRFDKVFTVNTIYFWTNPSEYLSEIKRILRPDGTLAICFADKTFMQNLPFTPYGFTLYEVETVKELLEKAGVTIKNTLKKLEQVQSKTGERVEREYYVVTAHA
ncbi:MULTISPECIES: class I SAM-dependent methyltransferase [unclassified Pedobacter]|uniref:class I SAM-dependent methyltransferase n=1 Tax=unclassified Pedobacter TaxID=2628915 RepID=UPI00141E2A74|nr:MULTISPECIES: class I SAM-dependent methyltransferase [unclassified Pedobacter]NII84368.1 SAM-dependent methyltransferase [Pedobacter sp. SG908]NMN38717.1 SAM-dependent methyltransferase [Pedobacter sp. SG918]